MADEISLPDGWTWSDRLPGEQTLGWQAAGPADHRVWVNTDSMVWGGAELVIYDGEEIADVPLTVVFAVLERSGIDRSAARITELERQVEAMREDHEAMQAMRTLRGDFQLDRQDTGDLSPAPHCRWTATRIKNRDWPDGQPCHAEDPARAVLGLLR